LLPLATLNEVIAGGKVSWVLEADLKNFFGSLSHEWVLRFVEHRVGDPRLISLIRRWLKAGVLEDGAVHPSEQGTPQVRAAATERTDEPGAPIENTHCITIPRVPRDRVRPGGDNRDTTRLSERGRQPRCRGSSAVPAAISSAQRLYRCLLAAVARGGADCFGGGGNGSRTGSGRSLARIAFNVLMRSDRR
jgi:hypothetical protein